AWLVFLAIPVLSLLMIGVHRYYRDVDAEVSLTATPHFGASGDVAVVLVNRLQKPVLKAIDYALAAQHDTTVAVHVQTDPDTADALQREWQVRNLPIPLIIVESPFRTYAQPVAEFINTYREKHGPS